VLEIHNRARPFGFVRRLRAALNGNNGSATNTDDVDDLQCALQRIALTPFHNPIGDELNPLLPVPGVVGIIYQYCLFHCGCVDPFSIREVNLREAWSCPTPYFCDFTTFYSSPNRFTDIMSEHDPLELWTEVTFVTHSLPLGYPNTLVCIPEAGGVILSCDYKLPQREFEAVVWAEVNEEALVLHQGDTDDEYEDNDFVVRFALNGNNGSVTGLDDVEPGPNFVECKQRPAVCRSNHSHRKVLPRNALQAFAAREARRDGDHVRSIPVYEDCPNIYPACLIPVHYHLVAPLLPIYEDIELQPLVPLAVQPNPVVAADGWQVMPEEKVVDHSAAQVAATQAFLAQQASAPIVNPPPPPSHGALPVVNAPLSFASAALNAVYEAAHPNIGLLPVVVPVLPRIDVSVEQRDEQKALEYEARELREEQDAELKAMDKEIADIKAACDIQIVVIRRLLDVEEDVGRHQAMQQDLARLCMGMTARLYPDYSSATNGEAHPNVYTNQMQRVRDHRNALRAAALEEAPAFNLFDRPPQRQYLHRRFLDGPLPVVTPLAENIGFFERAALAIPPPPPPLVIPPVVVPAVIPQVPQNIPLVHHPFQPLAAFIGPRAPVPRQPMLPFDPVPLAVHRNWLAPDRQVELEEPLLARREPADGSDSDEDVFEGDLPNMAIGGDDHFAVEGRDYIELPDGRLDRVPLLRRLRNAVVRRHPRLVATLYGMINPPPPPPRIRHQAVPAAPFGPPPEGVVYVPPPPLMDADGNLLPPENVPKTFIDLGFREVLLFMDLPSDYSSYADRIVDFFTSLIPALHTMDLPRYNDNQGTTRAESVSLESVESKRWYWNLFARFCSPNYNESRPVRAQRIKNVQHVLVATSFKSCRSAFICEDLLHDMTRMIENKYRDLNNREVAYYDGDRGGIACRLGFSTAARTAASTSPSYQLLLDNNPALAADTLIHYCQQALFLDYIRLLSMPRNLHSTFRRRGHSNFIRSSGPRSNWALRNV
jgi:hypothetical protein